MAPHARTRRLEARLQAGSLVLYPILLLVGFLMHPDLSSLERTTTAQQLADNFRHSELFHLGHLLVMCAVPLILCAHLGITRQLRGKGAWFGLVGGLAVLLGGCLLAVDKGSLCLVLSAFDTLPDEEFARLVPALQVIVDLEGLLRINRLLFLLPLGGILHAIGLMREGRVKTWEGVAAIFGLLLLNNPDIELISSIGAVSMIAGFAPLGLRGLAEIRGSCATP